MSILKPFIGFIGLISLLLGGLFLFYHIYYKQDWIWSAIPIICGIAALVMTSFLVSSPKEEKEEEEDKRILLSSEESLKRHYDDNLNQTRISLESALCIWFSGLGIIIIGIWIYYFKDDVDIKTFIVFLFIGLALVFTSAIFMFIHDQKQKRTLVLLNKILRIERLRAAYEIANNLNETEKLEAIKKVIDDLLVIDDLSHGQYKKSDDQTAKESNQQRS